MEKSIEFKIPQSGEFIMVRVSTHQEFLQCVEDIPSPFKHGKMILPVGMDQSNYKSIYIKCFIEELERIKIAKASGLSGESICHEVVDKFVKNDFKSYEVIQAETLFCNHYEIQYKYLIVT